jgi:hypothetical protein
MFVFLYSPRWTNATIIHHWHSTLAKTLPVCQHSTIMTTVWPVIALGMVAATSLLVPTIVVRFQRKRARSTPAVSVASAAGTENTDESSLNTQRCPPMFVATALPLVLMLLFLYAAAAQQSDMHSLWFLPVIILPVAVSALCARRKIRHEIIGRDHVTSVRPHAPDGSRDKSGMEPVVFAVMLMLALAALASFVTAADRTAVDFAQTGRMPNWSGRR